MLDLCDLMREVIGQHNRSQEKNSYNSILVLCLIEQANLFHSVVGLIVFPPNTCYARMLQKLPLLPGI